MYPYKLIRSARKTVSISISPSLEVLVKAPLRASKRDIEAILAKHEGWIEKHRTLTKALNEQAAQNVLSEAQIAALRQAAQQELPKRVAHFGALMGLTPAGVKITSAQTRWGSCSGKNRLCFSYKVMLLPDEAIDYVVVHELAHIRVKNHSADFYRLVAQYIPDYKARVALIRRFHMGPSDT